MNNWLSNILYDELTYNIFLTLHMSWLSFCLINHWMNLKVVAVSQPSKDIQQKIQSEKYVDIDTTKLTYSIYGEFGIDWSSHICPKFFIEKDTYIWFQI